MSDTLVVENTDPSFDEADAVALPKSQFQYRDYGFWTRPAIERSVTRYQHSLTKHELAPIQVQKIEIGTDVTSTPRGVLNRNQEPMLALPAVFRRRTIGDKSVSTLQEWECAVLDVRDDTVFAQATSVIVREPDQNYIEIPIFEFQPSDREKLRPGVIFRLIIGFVSKPNGQRTREAILYIRHQLPRATNDISPLLDILVDD